SELADAAGTTPRTIRYYTAEGLLPPPDSRGRYALYSNEHLDRLRLVNRLKDAFQPLIAIKARMEHLDHAEVRRCLDQSELGPPGQSLDELLINSVEIARERSFQETGHLRLGGRIAKSTAVTSVCTDLQHKETLRGHESDIWQRIMLAPGVELHV